MTSMTILASDEVRKELDPNNAGVVKRIELVKAILKGRVKILDGHHRFNGAPNGEIPIEWRCDKFYSEQQARDLGYNVDTIASVAYKGDRFAPTEMYEIFTDREVRMFQHCPVEVQQAELRLLKRLT